MALTRLTKTGLVAGAIRAGQQFQVVLRVELVAAGDDHHPAGADHLVGAVALALFVAVCAVLTKRFTMLELLKREMLKVIEVPMVGVEELSRRPIVEPMGSAPKIEIEPATKPPSVSN